MLRDEHIKQLFGVIARRDRAIQYAAAIRSSADVSGILDYFFGARVRWQRWARSRHRRIYD
jgi:hypothetical protein